MTILFVINTQRRKNKYSSIEITLKLHVDSAGDNKHQRLNYLWFISLLSWVFSCRLQSADNRRRSISKYRTCAPLSTLFEPVKAAVAGAFYCYLIYPSMGIHVTPVSMSQTDLSCSYILRMTDSSHSAESLNFTNDYANITSLRSLKYEEYYSGSRTWSWKPAWCLAM